jgi:hypothetical protein
MSSVAAGAGASDTSVIKVQTTTIKNKDFIRFISFPPLENSKKA